MRHLNVITLGFIMTTMSTCFEAAADETDLEKQQITEAFQLTTDAAKEYRIQLRGKESAPCKLLPKPILKWSNPVAGNIYGNVFLWTNEKQPVAVGSFYKWFSPWTHSTHEFHSLSSQPFTAEFSDATIWQPRRGGVVWKALDGVAKPAQAAPSRSLQMRRISRQFSVEKTDKEGELRRMRLLSQPVYRYASPNNGVMDGAMFVFVQGTDPELWLLIEAERANPPKTDEDPSSQIAKWRYAVARMNATRFRVKRNDKTIQEFPAVKWKNVSGIEDSYFKINAAELPSSVK